MRRTLAILSLTAAPLLAAAEPVSLLGIEVGAALTVPQCLVSEKDGTTVYFPEGDMCWHPAIIGDFTSAMTADWAPVDVVMSALVKPDFVRRDVSLILSKGRVVELVIPTYGDKTWYEVQKRLVEKLGEPRSAMDYPPGSIFLSHAEWRTEEGVEIEHQSFGRAGKENQGVIKVQAKSLRDRYDESRKQRKAKQLDL